MKEDLCSVCVVANHCRVKTLLAVQTQCGPLALATCPQETLPREAVMFTRVKADLLTCTWLCSEHIAFGEWM